MHFGWARRRRPVSCASRRFPRRASARRKTWHQLVRNARVDMLPLSCYCAAPRAEPPGSLSRWWVDVTVPALVGGSRGETPRGRPSHRRRARAASSCMRVSWTPVANASSQLRLSQAQAQRVVRLRLVTPRGPPRPPAPRPTCPAGRRTPFPCACLSTLASHGSPDFCETYVVV